MLHVATVYNNEAIQEQDNLNIISYCSLPLGLSGIVVHKSCPFSKEVAMTIVWFVLNIEKLSVHVNRMSRCRYDACFLPSSLGSSFFVLPLQFVCVAIHSMLISKCRIGFVHQEHNVFILDVCTKELEYQWLIMHSISHEP